MQCVNFLCFFPHSLLLLTHLSLKSIRPATSQQSALSAANNNHDLKADTLTVNNTGTKGAEEISLAAVAASERRPGSESKKCCLLARHWAKIDMERTKNESEQFLEINKCVTCGHSKRDPATVETPGAVPQPHTEAWLSLLTRLHLPETEQNF